MNPNHLNKKIKILIVSQYNLKVDARVEIFSRTF